MKATDYKTFDDYARARIAEGLQVLPRAMWKALKENNPNLAAPRRFIPANT
jgi:hypothetical protein